MILDILDRWTSYTWPNSRFQKGFAYLETLEPVAVKDGKVLLEGEELFCIFEEYETTPAEGHRFETHRRYADIQVLLEGQETILWAPREGLRLAEAYTPDIEFQHLTDDAASVVLTPGRFCVFFPQDAHAPCIAFGEPCRVRKVVIKVCLD